MCTSGGQGRASRSLTAVSVVNARILEFARAPVDQFGRPPDVLATNRVVLDPDEGTWSLVMRWRPTAGSWYLTLSTTSGLVVVSGAAVRDRTDVLLGVAPRLAPRPRGAIISYDPKKRGDPTLRSYALDDVRLYYLPDGYDPRDFAIYTSEVV